MIAGEKNAREEKRECEMYFTLNEFRVSAASFVEEFLFTSKTVKLFLEPSCVCVNSNYFKCFQTGITVNSNDYYIKMGVLCLVVCSYYLYASVLQVVQINLCKKQT